MFRGSIFIPASLIFAALVSPAQAVDQAAADRVKAEMAAYALARGETSEQFAARIGSPLWHVESFVHGVEESGGTAADALRRLETFVEALKDLERRQLLRCLGIPLPGRSEAPPSSIRCALLKHKFGAPPLRPLFAPSARPSGRSVHCIDLTTVETRIA